MTARIGPRQLELLTALGSPTRLAVSVGKEGAGLVKRGLLRSDVLGGCCITAAGLRALADEMDAGRIEDALTTMQKDVAARQRKVADRKADAFDAKLADAVADLKRLAEDKRSA